MFAPNNTLNSFFLKALDLHDSNRMCQRHLSLYAPKMKGMLTALEHLAEELKVMTDRNGLEYDVYPLFRFLKNLNSSLPLDIESISSLVKIKFLYFTEELLRILQGNVLNVYFNHVKLRLKCSGASETEDILQRLSKVCRILLLQPKLSFREFHIYEFMAGTLKLCFDSNIQNSALVVSLLKQTIRMQSIDPSESRFAQQQFYSSDFCKYLLRMSVNEKFDLASYCRCHPHTLWEYSRIFSVSRAASFGDYDRTLCLLQHGVEVFPINELLQTGHGFPDINETMPPIYLMILHVMREIKLQKQYMDRILSNISEPDSITIGQKTCFKLMWRAIPDPYVKQNEMVKAISAEYLHLAQHGVVNPMRHEKNIKLSLMYKTCFKELESESKRPRSLVHLARCSVRKSLKEAWNLPSGIFHLGLPEQLQRYLNLEAD